MKCPNCGADSISLLRRLSLGPAFPTKCKACNRKIGVSFRRTFLSATPYFVVLLLIYFIEDPLNRAILMLLGVVAATIMNLKLVPLIVVDRD